MPVLAALIAVSTGSAQPAVGAPPSGPPRPFVSSPGSGLTTALGAYCYAGGCVDTDQPPKTSRALGIEGGGEVLVDFIIPVRTASLVTRRGEHPYASVEQRDSAGRLWAFRIPSTTRSATDLLLGATYEQGSAEFGFRVAPRRPSR